jgi:cytochrome c oxidase cbb3-type subunit 3
MADKHVDDVTGVETTGHEWDGVRELNNPMPRWWVSLFYFTIVFTVVYTIFFPAWPLVETNTKGLLGYTSRGEVIEKVAAHREMQMQWKDRIAAADLEEIRQDPDLFQFSLASGRANFAVNCSQCHGAGAAGNPGGYPNLNDDAWIWGGDLENIYTTIKHGVRNEDDPDARYAEMPRYGVDELLSKEEIEAAAQHVLNFTGRATKPELLELGAETWEYNCAACHGEDGNRRLLRRRPQPHRQHLALWRRASGHPQPDQGVTWKPAAGRDAGLGPEARRAATQHGQGAGASMSTRWAGARRRSSGGLTASGGGLTSSLVPLPAAAPLTLAALAALGLVGRRRRA